MPKKNIDKMDREIIAMLQSNARVPLTTMATRLGVSTPTIGVRLSKLRQNKVILGFRPEVDWSSMGYDLLCFTTVLATYGKGHANTVARKLARIKGVIAVYFVMGDLDFVVVSRARDKSDISRITDEFEDITEIVRTNTHIVLKTIKEELYGPVL
jgi:DNA-binding Lrp family transcriptional regulator